jgi:hypothetical protein
MIPLFCKLFFLFHKTFDKWILKTFDKGYIYVPTSSEIIYKSFTPLFETIFTFTMAWSLLDTFSTIVSGNAWLVANDWLCVLCLTLVELLICGYDLQVGLWPNLSKNHQINNGQWGYSYKIIFIYLPSKTYFDVSLSINPTTLFLMKGVFIFKTQVYQKLEIRFTLCEHSFHFTNIFYKSTFTTTFAYF